MESKSRIRLLGDLAADLTGLRQRRGRPLAERPTIAASGLASAGRSATSATTQPRQGLVGLVVVGALVFVLLVAWGGPTSTLHVLGIVSVYALPGAVVVALWWEDWPGTHFRPRWSGLVDTVLVAVTGIAAAVLGQTLLQHADLGALFATGGPGQLSAFPVLLPLGATVFTVMLQITLVTEGWPLRRLGRLGGGAAAWALSWIVGLLIERSLVGTGVLDGVALASVLSCVAAVQVLGWVVLRGAPMNRIASRPIRLVVGNAATIGLGVMSYSILRLVPGQAPRVGALGAGIVGAGLVVGMLFQGWPAGARRRSTDGIARVLVTVLLGWLGVVACERLAPLLGVPQQEAAGWATYALNTVATAVIVHVGINRRWPMREPAA